MKNQLAALKLDLIVTKQISECVNLVQEIFGSSLLGIYLYGSSILGGLQKYSDIDLFVVTTRATTHAEKAKIATALLKISGIYMRDIKLPIELTIVEKSQINPWHYPPKFDFQYGEWLRIEFAEGNVEPWPSKVMPDLALLITQILLAHKTLTGLKVEQLLCQVPYKDFMSATVEALPGLVGELDNDTRNVLLTLARIWSTLATSTICSKPAAADWVLNKLPEQYRVVIARASAICQGAAQEYWDDLQPIIKPCADFILKEINKQISEIKVTSNLNRSIKIACNIT